jgi:hypothetical protein
VLAYPVRIVPKHLLDQPHQCLRGELCVHLHRLRL